MYNRNETEKNEKLVAEINQTLQNYAVSQQDVSAGYKIIEYAKKGNLKGCNRFVQSILDDYYFGFNENKMFPYLILRLAHTNKLTGVVK